MRPRERPTARPTTIPVLLDGEAIPEGSGNGGGGGGGRGEGGGGGLGGGGAGEGGEGTTRDAQAEEGRLAVVISEQLRVLGVRITGETGPNAKIPEPWTAESPSNEQSETTELEGLDK